MAYCRAVTDQPDGQQSTSSHASDRTKKGPTPRRDAARGHESALDRFFKISERGSTVEREIRGGVVTFFTMAYIIVLNPLILGFAPDANGHFLGGGTGDGSNLPAIAAGTALVAGVMTILMGVVANYPLALATGLGPERVRRRLDRPADELVGRDGTDRARGRGHPGAGAHRLPEGGLPCRPVAAEDRDLGRHRPVHRASSASSTPASYAGSPTPPAPPSRCSWAPTASSRAGRSLVFVFGLALVITLWVLRVRGAILISILATTVLAIDRRGDRRHRAEFAAAHYNPTGWSLNVPSWPDKVFDTPGLRHPRPRSTSRRLRARSASSSAVLLIFTLMLADFFDTMGTMTAIGAEAGLLDDDGTPPNTQQILVVDSVAAAAGGAAGVSSQHVVHRVRLGRRRGRAHRPRVRRHRRCCSCLDLLRAAGAA